MEVGLSAKKVDLAALPCEMRVVPLMKKVYSVPSQAEPFVTNDCEISYGKGAFECLFRGRSGKSALAIENSGQKSLK